MSSNALVWTGCIVVAGIFYAAAVAYLTPRIHRLQRLKKRLDSVGNKAVKEWQETRKIDARRLKKARIESRFRDLFQSRKSWMRDIQYLLYRSGAFSQLHVHLGVFGGCGVLIAYILFIMFPVPFFSSLLIGFLLSFFIQIFHLKWNAKKWQKKFIKSFPPALDIIVRGLRSGMTLGRGIAMVSEEMEPPVGTEFNYIVAQLQLGIPQEFALREASNRIGTDDFRIFAIALIIQQEMGGSLTDILAKLSDVMRQREKFRGKVWTMSSEARTTAAIVTALPLLTAVAIEMLSPGYLRFFIVDPTGFKMLLTSIVLNFTGLIVIMRMIKFE